MIDNIDFDIPFYLNVLPQDQGKRIDRYISDIIPDISRTYIQKLIKYNNIIVNSKFIKANYKVNSYDSVSITLPSPEKLDIIPENIDIDITYEDDDIIIVNKPKGMVVHPAPGHHSGTLVNALLYHCNNNLSGINGVLRPGIVHRIDRDTTGLLIVCKNDISHRKIAEQLALHSITRKYRAIVFGNIKEDSGTINKPIARNPIDRKKMAVCKNGSGKNAITNYQVLERYNSKLNSNSYTYIECHLETGRTHQIRVHMSSISHPLLGDTVYGRNHQPFSTDGQVLHAKTIGFIHPSKNEYIEFDSELPNYFKYILNNMNI